MRSAALVFRDTGYGTARDVRLLEGLLRQHGFRVAFLPIRRHGNLWERRWKYLKQRLLRRSYTLQFHLEQIHREQFAFARHNFVIPNPEFTDRDVFPKCRGLSGVLAKTREAEALFRESGVPVRYLGFTAEDRQDPSVEKRFERFLHVEGKSNYKGSRALVELWSRHPEWPELLVLRSRLDSEGRPRAPHRSPGPNVRIIEEFLPDPELRRLQNACGIHVCPSEVEGFGHYLVEGSSCSAIIMTTDAAPMNEHVSEDSGFCIRAVKQRPQGMTWRYRCDPVDFERKMEDLLRLDRASLEAMSRRSRARYEESRRSFELAFGELLQNLDAGVDLVLPAREPELGKALQG